MALPVETDVAIIGAGPTGLATACSLLSRNINCTIIDLASGPDPTSRATVIHSRTLEVLESSGITTKMLALGLPVSAFSLRSESTELARLDFSELGAVYNTMMTLPQCETERLLREKLISLGGSIHWGHRATSVVDDGSGVFISVQDPKDCGYILRCKYIVGSDGHRSSVRKAAGINFIGGEYTSSFVVADVLLSSWPLATDELQLCLALRGGFLLYMPQPGENKFRIVGTEQGNESQPSIDVYQKLSDERGPTGVKIEKMTWSSRFSVHHRLAERYRTGRMFLAGDAAHVVSPVGGQGMNIGIQDGVELGAILAEALNGGTIDLDDYERTRRPIAENVVGLTHRITTTSNMKNGWLRAIRNPVLGLLASVPAFRVYLMRRLAEL